MDKHEELVRPELVIVTDGLDKDVPTMKRKDFGVPLSMPLSSV